MPTISVIVPVYKVEPYLRRCVDSILQQTYTDFELILVDDGSPDSCPALCDEYKALDSRVKVIHQQNGGLSAARNAGIDWAFAHSDSRWIYFADSDDWIHPMSLEALYNAAQQTGLSVIIGGHQRTVGDNPEVDTAQLQPVLWETEEFFCKNNITAIVAWGKLYRKECFRDIRYPVGKIHEDEFTTYKILFAFDRIAVIPQPLYAYYQNPDGITGQRWKPGRLVVAEAHDERVQYFIERKHSSMIQWSLLALFGFLQWSINEIRQSDLQVKERYEKQTIRLYEESIKKYRKFFSLSTFRKAYGYIYPSIDLIARICLSIKQRVIRGSWKKFKEKLARK